MRVRGGGEGGGEVEEGDLDVGVRWAAKEMGGGLAWTRARRGQRVGVDAFERAVVDLHPQRDLVPDEEAEVEREGLRHVSEITLSHGRTRYAQPAHNPACSTVESSACVACAGPPRSLSTSGLGCPSVQSCRASQSAPELARL